MRRIIILSFLLIFTLCTLPAYSLDLSIEVLKSKDCKVPKSFARVVKVGKTEKILFGKSSNMYCPTCLNDILNAYGAHLSGKTLKAEDCKVPKSFAKIEKIDSDDKEGRIVYGKRTILYSAASLNNIFTAYGLSLPLEALKNKESNLPKHYATILKENNEEKIIFDNSWAYGPKSLSNILSSYQ